MSDVVKQGYVKFQSKNLGIWKKRWLVLKMHSRRGPVRLEKYTDEVASISSGKYRMIDLSRIENIYRLPDFERKCAIHITVDCMESVQFSVDSELECENWLKMIQGEIQGALVNRDSFNVYLTKHPKLPTHGECTMEVTDTEIRLLNHRDQEIVSWPLNKLRKYGVERNMFTIEAGRSCVTGEGIFVFESEAADDIYSRVNNVTKSQALAKRNELIQTTSKQTKSQAVSQSNSANSDNQVRTSASRYNNNNSSNLYYQAQQERPNEPSGINELSRKRQTEVGRGNEYKLENAGMRGAGSTRSRGRNNDEDDDCDSEYVEIPR